MVKRTKGKSGKPGTLIYNDKLGQTWKVKCIKSKIMPKRLSILNSEITDINGEKPRCDLSQSIILNCLNFLESEQTNK